MMKKNWISILLFSLVTVYCDAQTAGYKFYSTLDSVKTSGFYNIEITPALSAHLKTDYSDLRIVNDSGKWIPHVLRSENQSLQNSIATTIKIEEKKNIGNFTEIILKNDGNFHAAFDILITTTNANRSAKLSGSHNTTDWFVIEDSIMLAPTVTTEKNRVKYNIQFPLCNYKFYKILIDNKNNDPVNILSVTYNAVLVEKQIRILSQNPLCTLLQMDSAKTSYIKVTQDEPYHFGHFNIKISGSPFFYRKLDMFLPNTNKNSFSNPGELFQSFNISNNSALEFSVPFTNPKEFYLLIHNEDNLPLKIEAVKTWSNQFWLTAYLEKGNHYKLIMDNKAAEIPDYDLSKLDIKLSDSIAFLSFQKIIPFTNAPATAITHKNNSWILWTAIIAALFILLLFTLKMAKEVNKRKQDDSV